jgi:hypothetical protein
MRWAAIASMLGLCLWWAEHDSLPWWNEAIMYGLGGASFMYWKEKGEEDARKQK